MNLFCKHEWDKVSDVTFPSAVEQLHGMRGDITVYKWAFCKTHIVILTCKKCGKVHKAVTHS